MDLSATVADEGRHVLDDAENGRFHALEHVDALARIEQGDILRCCDDHSTVGVLDDFGHREWLVPGSRRRVHHQVVQFTPLHIR